VRRRLYGLRCALTKLLDFRMIPVGDIDLRREINLNRKTGVVERQRRCIRSVYTARIDRRKSEMTVVLYHGDKAEEVGFLLYAPQSS
jgi:hypothetical protein